MNQPDQRQDRGVILFESIHHVLAAEKVLQERSLWHDMIPVPRGLSSDCGMAIEVQFADLAGICDLLADSEIRLRGVFRPQGSGYAEVPR